MIKSYFWVNFNTFNTLRWLRKLTIIFDMRKLLVAFILAIFVLIPPCDAWGGSKIAGQGSRFPGFKKGQYGLGGVIGQPFSGRFQRWIDWKRSWFADVGYQIDEFLVTHANYAIYLISEDDRWRLDRRVGTMLTSVFGGITAAAYLGEKEEETSRLGLRLGGAFEYLIPKTSWSVRIEVAPVLFLSGRTAGGLQGGIGFMYYFDQKTGKGAVKDYSADPGVTDEFLKGEANFEDTELAQDEPKRKKRKKKKKKARKKRKKRKAKKKKAREKKSYRIEKFEESGGDSDSELMVEDEEI